MKFELYLSLLLFLGSIGAGSFLGILANRMNANPKENKLHLIFYTFSTVVIISVIVSYLIYFKDYFSPFNWYSICVSILTIGASISLIFATKKYLIVKSVFHVSELDPIINEFTSNADKNEIKLFGGDLNFFGNSPSEMDLNLQFIHLKSLNFNRIAILCEEPNDISKKIRYGKIYSELRNVELKFYNPEKADLRVRGRIIEFNGSPQLLMYTKYSQGRYQALQTDTANSNGALYRNIWQLTWSMAVAPTQPQIQDYIKIFNG